MTSGLFRASTHLLTMDQGIRYNLIPPSTPLFDTIIWYFGLEIWVRWQTEAKNPATLGCLHKGCETVAKGANFSFPFDSQKFLYFLKNVIFRNDKTEWLSLSMRMANTLPNVNGYPVVVEYNLNLYSGPIGFFFIDTCFVKYLNTV